MHYDLNQIRGNEDRFAATYPPSAFDTADQLYRTIEPVSLDFDITKDDRRYHLVGRVRTAIELTCGRCLEPFRFPIDAVFDLRYLPRGENTGEGEIEIEEDDLATAFYSDALIDLGQLMAEQFHLALPMKPLCAVACRGLCPQCGADLNIGSCSCKRAWEDPRLAGLKSMLKNRD